MARWWCVLCAFISCSGSVNSTPPPQEPAPVRAAPPQEPVQVVPAPGRFDARVVELGRRLFHEPRLSPDSRTSCASCHDLARWGTSPAPGKHDLDTPTVFNATLNPRQFWDGRASSLEAQIDGPLTGTREMRSSWAHVLAVLEGDAEYRSRFEAAFPEGLTAQTVRVAIASFERTLLTPGSRFDRFINGESPNALTPDERHGYALFKSYGCASCHQGANLGGNLFQRLGALRPLRAGETAKLRVPPLRLAVHTAPYFHDGSVATLDEAIFSMGELQLGIEIPARDRADIAAFLSTLPGEREGAGL